MLGLVVMLFTSSAYTSELDDKIIAMSQNPIVTSQGKALYEEVCASCHSKDLSGASGFNLKDGEWIHGHKPSTILSNVKKGFSKAGMPSFSAVYTEPQLQAIVAYVLSKREGFDGLTYKIYQMANSNDKVISDKKLIKEGELTSNFADFQLPEIKDYVLEFEGDFYTLKDEDTQIWIEWGMPIDVTFEIKETLINGKKIERLGEGDNPTWKLERGKQHLKVTYYSGKNELNRRNWPLMVTNDDTTIKLFPFSTRARQIMSKKKVHVIATSKTVVQRKKTTKIPAYSISVGLPAKVNYAFNTRLCAVVGLWQGDLLNVGPNVGGRGQDGSVPLGDWVFHAPNSIKHSDSGKGQCKYKGYKLENNEPVFRYQLDGAEYKLSASANNDREIQFHYQVNQLTAPTVAFTVPKIDKLTWHASSGKVKNERVNITPDTQGQFTLTAQIN